MTRKRFIKLLRALATEIANQMDSPIHHIEYRIDERPIAAASRKTNKSYAEKFKILEPLAHKYGIGNY